MKGFACRCVAMTSEAKHGHSEVEPEVSLCPGSRRIRILLERVRSLRFRVYGTDGFGKGIDWQEVQILHWAVMWLIQFQPARENACSQTDIDDQSSLTQGIRQETLENEER